MTLGNLTIVEFRTLVNLKLMTRDIKISIHKNLDITLYTTFVQGHLKNFLSFLTAQKET